MRETTHAIMTKLKAYQSKRDLNQTREPAGKSAGNASQHRYVLHKHDASQLHYDLRLEQDGVLRSWAIPKGPDLKVGEKRLAVEVEDHPLEYGDFEGVIPKGAYGGGTVMIWDSGQWAATGQIKNGHIDFVLYGEKLKGAWTLVRMGGQRGRNNKKQDNGKNWLLIKRHEPDGREYDAETLAGLGEQSVRSGRSMARIAAEGSDDHNSLDKDGVGPIRRR